jgi:ATP-dependent Clp protease protease subunit
MKEAYAVYCGLIDQVNAQKLVNTMSAAMADEYEHVHVLLQSAGGFVGDGVFLYNYLRAIPMKLTLYNAGQISSAGVIAYLGAQDRVATKVSSFMLHRSTSSLQFATSARLSNAAKALTLDDERTEAILREYITMPEALWNEMNFHDLHLSGEEAFNFGIATSIGNFSPPSGAQVYNCLA